MVDLPDPVGPVIRMIHLSANVLWSTISERSISPGVGIIQGIIRIATLSHLIVRDILTRNLATHCEYDTSILRSSNLLPRKNSQIFSNSNPLTVP